MRQKGLEIIHEMPHAMGDSPGREQKDSLLVLLPWGGNLSIILDVHFSLSISIGDYPGLIRLLGFDD
jgi:hypothetical protein